ncbi:hypothetical protein KC326_g204 [Hortaea werneckii]|nr:hypothetical protein KC326_g204 [Hortaea werneckii]
MQSLLEHRPLLPLSVDTRAQKCRDNSAPFSYSGQSARLHPEPYRYTPESKSSPLIADTARRCSRTEHLRLLHIEFGVVVDLAVETGSWLLR